MLPLLEVVGSRMELQLHFRILVNATKIPSPKVGASQTPSPSLVDTSADTEVEKAEEAEVSQ